MAAMDIYDSDGEGLFGSSVRTDKITVLLAAYPNNKILQYILVPVFFYHYKMQVLTSPSMLLGLLTCPYRSGLLWATALFAISGWCIVFEADDTRRIAGAVVLFLVGFIPLLMLVYLSCLCLKPWGDL